jgi:tetratricopeptide (TPR) repeat protein
MTTLRLLLLMGNWLSAVRLVAGGSALLTPEILAAAPSELSAGHDTPGHVTPVIAHGARPSAQAIPEDATPEEIASLLRIAPERAGREAWSDAETAYRQVLRARATEAQDREALVGLARLYRAQGRLPQAAAVYEKILHDFPGDPLSPLLYLELGRTHRALGAHKLALARFYSVLNSTLKLPGDDQGGAERYRQYARTAQFEIAESHYLSGEYVEARRFYERLNLLDLAPVDRARVGFQAVRCLVLVGEKKEAVAALRRFLEQHPQSAEAPEARYLLATELHALGRKNEALAATLELLRGESARHSAHSAAWALWQRRTGNQLANAFFKDGDFSSALQLYQTLLALDPTPAWQIPVLYQTALCYERLAQFERAHAAYSAVVTAAAADTAAAPGLTELAAMARWRRDRLAWQSATDAKVALLLTAESSPSP